MGTIFENRFQTQKRANSFYVREIARHRPECRVEPGRCYIRDAGMDQTLLLNQGFEPIKVISWQRAITLLFLGKVEVLEEYDRDIRSVTMVIKIPAVVRLLRAFRRHARPVKFSRVNIYARDNYRCQYCGKKAPISDLTYDHVLPRSQGGLTEWTNIVSCCYLCNRKKGGRTPNEAGM